MLAGQANNDWSLKEVAMKNAYRGHYQSASNELVPWADPYIAGLVALSAGQTAPVGRETNLGCRDAARQVGPARGFAQRNVPADRGLAPRRLHTGRSSLAAMSHGW